MRLLVSRYFLCVAVTALALSQWAAADSNNQIFVERSFHDLLNRTPSASELLAYTTPLDSATATRAQVAASIDGMDEYHGVETKNDFLKLLLRQPAPQELTGWVQFLDGGGTNEQIMADMAGSTEYFQNRGGGTNDGFVTVLYSDLLARSPAPQDRLADDQALAQGLSRTSLASSLLGSLEYDTDLVGSFFSRFLHRSPNGGESAGFVNELQSSVRDETVIAQIVGSSEYAALPLLPGDSNFDGKVNFADLVALARNYGTSGAHWFEGDFNNDGSVGFDDLVALARDYGQALSPAQTIATVPEPVSIGIIAMMAGAALVRRRRLGGHCPPYVV